MGSNSGQHHPRHSTSYVEGWIEGITSHDARRRALLRRTAGLLPFALDAPVRVLDLGGGYGEFSELILDLFPRARVCLADYSVPMVERARWRLAEFGDRVEYRVEGNRFCRQLNYATRIAPASIPSSYSNGEW